MAVRLRDINPVVLLHNLAVGHSNTPVARIDIRHDVDEDKVMALFCGSGNLTDGRKTSIELGESCDQADGKSMLMSYVYDTTIGEQEFLLYHRGDTEGLNIRKGGNVGIGLSKSTHKLGVIGEAAFSNATLGTKLSWSTGNSSGILDTYGDHNLEFRTNNTQRMFLSEHGLGINTQATANERLRVNGKINILDALNVNGNVVIDSTGHISWGNIKDEPSWLATAQSSVQVGSFGGSLGWDKVGTTGSPRPTWLESSQGSVKLSGFDNDLGASSQWTDKTNTYGSDAHSGIYYTDSNSKKGKVTIGDNQIIQKARLYVRDDTNWQVRLRNANTGGSSFYLGVNASNQGSGSNGKLLIGADNSDAANAKFCFTKDGALWINEAPTNSEVEKLVVNGDVFFKAGTTYLRNSSDQIVVMDSATSATDSSKWWYIYTTGADGNLGWYRDGDLMKLFNNGGLSVAKGSITSGYRLDVNGSARASSFVASSDANKKRDITNCDLGLNFVEGLNPVSFAWKDYEEVINLKDGSTRTEQHTYQRKHYGFTAQQVKETLDALGIEDFGGYKDSSIKDPNKPAEYSLDYQQFIGPLVKAVQELSEKVKDLENTANPA